MIKEEPDQAKRISKRIVDDTDSPTQDKERREPQTKLADGNQRSKSSPKLSE